MWHYSYLDFRRPGRQQALSEICTANMPIDVHVNDRVQRCLLLSQRYRSATLECSENAEMLIFAKDSYLEVREAGCLRDREIDGTSDETRNNQGFTSVFDSWPLCRARKNVALTQEDGGCGLQTFAWCCTKSLVSVGQRPVTAANPS